MLNSGIYIITNTLNGNVYIGSACNLRQRFADHRKTLRGNRHANRHLQKAWNSHGESAFTFHVAERLAPADLIRAEQRRIDLAVASLDRTALYNISLIAGSRLGVKQTDEAKRKVSVANTGKKRSPEVRELLSRQRRGKKRNPESMAKTHAAHRGMKRSEETKAKMRAASAKRDRSTWTKTPEHKAKIGSAQRAAHQRRRLERIVAASS